MDWIQIVGTIGGLLMGVSGVVVAILTYRQQKYINRLQLEQNRQSVENAIEQIISRIISKFGLIQAHLMEIERTDDIESKQNSRKIAESFLRHILKEELIKDK